jgi:hypothetical protein
MRKYADPNQPKFRAERKDGIPGTSRSISKYANRNQKKRMRQKSKLGINKVLKLK